MDILIILPNQLFNVKYYNKKYDKVIIFEASQYFKKYKYNKKKLILHRASMKAYYDYLTNKNMKVSYIEYKKKLVLVKKK